MIQKLLSEITIIYMAYGATDFRKQIPSLCAEVRTKFDHLQYTEKTGYFQTQQLEQMQTQYIIVLYKRQN